MPSPVIWTRPPAKVPSWTGTYRVAVPVAALVALAGGGYGVQVVTGTASHYVRVQLGMFGGGRVQVSGNGIAAGTRVGVPS